MAPFYIIREAGVGRLIIPFYRRVINWDPERINDSSRSYCTWETWDWNPAPWFQSLVLNTCTPCFFQCPPTPPPLTPRGWKPRSDSLRAGFAMRNPESEWYKMLWLDNIIVRCFRTPGRCIGSSITCYKQISEWESSIPRAVPSQARSCWFRAALAMQPSKEAAASVLRTQSASLSGRSWLFFWTVLKFICLQGDTSYCPIHKSFMLSCVRLFATPWSVACQTLLSMGFSRQEYWSGFPCPPPGDLLDSGTEPAALKSPALAGRFFTTKMYEGS